MQVNVTVSCEPPDSFEVEQVRGMFGMEKGSHSAQTFEVEVPDRGELIDGKAWQIGLIVGPSGSGKTTVAREAYGKQFIESIKWDKKKAVVAQFGEQPIKIVTNTLSSVGFSSPPAWVKPYHVLSNGERFRCDLARALLQDSPIVAFDEYTSVVDRTAAKIGSAAIAKSIRKGRIEKQFVAIGCHYDVIEWLEPDWVLDMASGQLARGRLQQGRPPIKLTIAPVHRSAWQLFGHHHYLTSALSQVAKCFAAFWENQPVGFDAWMHRMTRKRRANDMREHRIVVLPDYQGLGIGNRLSDFGASVWCGDGRRAFSTTSHPAVIAYRNRSPNWKAHRFGMVAPIGRTGKMRSPRDYGGTTGPTCSAGRVTAGFQYVGEPCDAALARAMVDATPKVFGDDIAMRLLSELVDSDCLYSIGALAKRIAAPTGDVKAALHKLTATSEISRQRVGSRVLYCAARDS